MSKAELNFDSGDTSNLEGGIATLRLVNALYLLGHKKDHTNTATKTWSEVQTLLVLGEHIHITIESEANNR